MAGPLFTTRNCAAAAPAKIARQGSREIRRFNDARNAMPNDNREHFACLVHSPLEKSSRTAIIANRCSCSLIVAEARKLCLQLIRARQVCFRSLCPEVLSKWLGTSVLAHDLPTSPKPAEGRSSALVATRIMDESSGPICTINSAPHLQEPSGVFDRSAPAARSCRQRPRRYIGILMTSCLAKLQTCLKFPCIQAVVAFIVGQHVHAQSHQESSRTPTSRTKQGLACLVQTHGVMHLGWQYLACRSASLQWCNGWPERDE